MGPVVGGGFEKVTWRWAFYINLCAGGALLPIWLFLLPSSDGPAEDSVVKRLRGFDFLGTLLIIGAVLGLILALNFGGSFYAWDSGQIIALFVVAGVCTILFLFQQDNTFRTDTSNRIFPIHFLKNKDAILLFILAAACDGACFIPTYYIPLYFQFTRGDNALVSSFRLLPYIVSLVVAILGSGYFMSRLGHFKPWYIGGSMLTIIGGAFMCRFPFMVPISP